MIHKFKKWLGIEGVKLELLVPEEIKKDSGFVDGRVIFSSMNPQVVTSITLRMLERYTHGRGDGAKTTELEIGSITFEQPIQVPAHQEVPIDFALPYQLVPSTMDEFGGKNLIAKGLAHTAKAIRGVKSEYRVIATATVKGTALDPFDEKWIVLE